MKIIFQKTKVMLLIASTLTLNTLNAQFTEKEWNAIKPLPPTECLQMGGEVIINGYSNTYPFVDFFKLNLGWTTSSKSFDENGYVNNGIKATTRIDLTNVPKDMKFKILWDGAPLNIAISPIKVAGIQIEANSFSQTSSGGKLSVSNRTADFVYITVENSQLAPNHIRNIRMVREGYENTYLSKPFNPEFIAQLSTLQMLKVNSYVSSFLSNSISTEWKDRTTKDSFSQVRNSNSQEIRNIAFEYVIEMANEVKKDLWINIPYSANSNYVKEMAKLFKAQLNPNIKIYVETADEIWNTTTNAFQYFYKLGNASTFVVSDTIINRVKRNWQIFRTTYAEDSAKVNRVLGVQTSYSPSLTYTYFTSPFNYGKFEVIGTSVFTYPLQKQKYLDDLANSNSLTPVIVNQTIFDEWKNGNSWRKPLTGSFKDLEGIVAYSKAANKLGVKLMVYTLFYEGYNNYRNGDALIINNIASRHKATLEPIYSAIYDTLKAYGVSALNVNSASSLFGATFDNGEEKQEVFNGVSYTTSSSAVSEITLAYQKESKCDIISGAYPMIPTSLRGILNVFPNPTNGSITIQSSEDQGEAYVECFNNIGHPVFSGKLLIGERLDVLSNQPTGLYQINVLINGKKSTTKVLKN